MRTREEIRVDVINTYNEYKGLTPGSPRFNAVSKKLKKLDAELCGSF